MGDEYDAARRARQLADLRAVWEPASQIAAPSQPPATGAGPLSYPSRPRGPTLRERLGMAPSASSAGARSLPSVLPPLPPLGAPAALPALAAAPLAQPASAPSLGSGGGRDLTGEELAMNRRLRSLGVDVQLKPRPPPAPPPPPPEPPSPLSLARAAAVSTVVQDRRDDMSLDDELFCSPQGLRSGRGSKRAAPSDTTQAPPARRARRGTAAADVKPEPWSPEPAGAAAEAGASSAPPVGSVMGEIADAAFQVRPGGGAALQEGAEEPLELRSAPGDPQLQLTVPASINRYLRDYQRQGVQFLFRQYARGTGGVLADDMGLGKTVQTIAFCAALLGKTGDARADSAPRPLVAGKRRAPILIVAPASVLDNWVAEFQRWGDFAVCLYSGRTKGSAVAGVRSGTQEAMLISFQAFRTDAAELNKLPWHAVIVDEVHTLKNVSSQVCRAACAVPTLLRYGLTGTVMQNAYDELWTVLSGWAVPGCLGPDLKTFIKEKAEPLKKAQQKTATPHTRGQGAEIQAGLRSQLAAVMLRRRKGEVLASQLPAKTDHIVFCELTDLQLRAYRRVLASPDVRGILASLADCGCGSGRLAGNCCALANAGELQEGCLWRQYHLCGCANARHPVTNPDGCKWHKPEGCPGPRLRCPLCLVLPALTILQKISNHLELIKADPEECGGDRAALERREDVAEMVLGEDALALGGLQVDRTFLGLSDASSCGKLLALQKLLRLWSDDAAARNKVLIFSSSLKMLDILQQVVSRAAHTFCRLDGGTPREDRQRLVNEFNSNAGLFCFLISTRAGGTGLNLAAANKVVVVDPSWNPAQDLQAMDRAYRLGQTRDVAVYRLITRGTLEENIYNRQIYKQQSSRVAVENETEQRYFEALQKERGGTARVKGELFGVDNMFRLTAGTATFERVGEGHCGYTIQAVQAGQLGPPGSGSSSDPDLAQQLAQEQGLEPGDPEAAALLEAGVLQTLLHDGLLGGGGGAQGAAKARAGKRAAQRAFKAEEAARLQRHEAHQQASLAAAAELRTAANGGTDPLRRRGAQPAASSAHDAAAARAVASLAAWQNCSPGEMAVRLLSMGAAARLQLRQQYAAAHP